MSEKKVSTSKKSAQKITDQDAQDRQQLTAEDIQDGETKELITKARRIITTSLSLGTELQGIVEAIGAGGQRKRRKLDENGEPTWEFLVRVPLPKDIFVTKTFRKYAEQNGLNGERCDHEFLKFCNYYNRTGKRWQSWIAVWQKWVRSNNSNPENLVPRTPGNISRPDHGAI